MRSGVVAGKILGDRDRDRRRAARRGWLAGISAALSMMLEDNPSSRKDPKKQCGVLNFWRAGKVAEIH